MRNYVFGGLRASLVENMREIQILVIKMEKEPTSNIKQA